MDLVELIETVSSSFDAADIPHAFGGALALAYIAEPRGTVDIDVNVFLDASELAPIESALGALGFTRRSSGDIAIAGVRFESSDSPFPIDVFPALDERYDEIRARTAVHPFGRSDSRLPFLHAIDLCVFKLSLGRPKDWVDLAAIAGAVPDLDLDAVEDLLIGLRGPTMYPRVTRFRTLF